MKVITIKNTLIIAAASLGLSSLAGAEQIPPESSSAHDMVFVKADGDQNGVLTRAEFEIFVALKAAQNIEDYPDVQAKSLEHAVFSAKDLNSDGLLTTNELSYSAPLTETQQDAAPTDDGSADSNEAAEKDINSKSHGS